MDIYIHKNANNYVHMLQEDKNYNFAPIMASIAPSCDKKYRTINSSEY